MWHTKEPLLLNGHECRVLFKIFSPSLGMVTSPYEWKIEWDEKHQISQQTNNQWLEMPINSLSNKVWLIWTTINFSIFLALFNQILCQSFRIKLLLLYGSKFQLLLLIFNEGINHQATSWVMSSIYFNQWYMFEKYVYHVPDVRPCVYINKL